MREVLDRLKAQLMDRLPVARTAGFGGEAQAASKVDLGELGAIASAVRDYMESELIYKQAKDAETSETA